MSNLTNASPHANVANEAQRASIDNIVGGYLQNVLPLGDGIFGGETSPFFKVITQMFQPSVFKSKYDMVAKIASSIGRPLVGDASATDVYKNLDPQDQIMVGELAANVLDYTNKFSFTTPVRESWRARYVPLVQPTMQPGNQYCEYQLQPTHFTPERICALLGSLRSLDLSRQEYKAMIDQINQSLLPLLRIVKASGDMNAYKLLLDLCNTAESYFVLASTVSSLASTAQMLVPLQDMAPLTPGSTLDIAPIVDLNLAPVQNVGAVNNMQDMINNMSNVLMLIQNSIMSAGIPINQHAFQTVAQSLQAISFRSAQFISAVAYGKPITQDMIDQNVTAGLASIVTYGSIYGLPAQVSIMLSVILANIAHGDINNTAALVDSLGLTRQTPLANKAEFNDFQKAVYADYLLGVDIYTRVYALSVNIPIIGLVAERFVGPGKYILPDTIMAFARSKDPSITTFTPSEISNYILSAEQRLSISPDVVEKLRDVLMALFSNR